MVFFYVSFALIFARSARGLTTVLPLNFALRNLPTCAVAIAVLFFFLKIDNQKRATWPEFRDAFDFIGLCALFLFLEST